MAVHRLITVAAGFAALCCPAWARASLCRADDCSKGKCSCVSRVGDGCCAGDGKFGQLDLCDQVKGGVAHRCDCVLSCCIIEAPIASTPLRLGHEQTGALALNEPAGRGLPNLVAEIQTTSGFSHNRRQAYLGVWLK